MTKCQRCGEMEKCQLFGEELLAMCDECLLRLVREFKIHQNEWMELATS